MSNKERLIFALENAEMKENEVEFYYTAADGFQFQMWMIPEVITNVKEILIYDATYGSDHSISVLAHENVYYNEEENEFQVYGGCGTLTIKF